MCKYPSLTKPDFTKTFTIDCDTSKNGTGAILMQGGRPLFFKIQPIKGN